MKKSQFILAVTLLAGGLAFAGTYEKMVVTPQPACGPWYVAAYGGGSFYDDVQVGNPAASLSADNGWIAGGAVGLRTDKAWRFELDLNQAHSPLTVGEIERTSMMVNAVKEFPALQFLGLTPYVGAGVGLTNINSNPWVDETVLGYQFLGGLVFDLTDCLQAFAEYRLMGQSDATDTFGGSADLGWAQHVILGVRWFF